MTGIRERIEARFERFAALICRRPWWFVVAILIAVAGLGSGVTKLEIDTSNEAFLHESDPILVRYEEFRRQFGRDDLIVVAIEPDALFTAATLDRIEALHADLQEHVPHLADINSLVNARNTLGRGDTLLVDDLLAQRPQTPADFKALEARVMGNPLYRNRLVSADGRLTTIALELDSFAAVQGGGDVLAGFDEPKPADKAPPAKRFLSDADVHAAVAEVGAILDKYRAPGFKLYMAGPPPVTDALKIELQSDMRRFMALAVLIIGVTLWLMFRNVSGVVLPLLGVVLSLIATIGSMGHFGVSFKVPTAILPSFLLAVGVGASVHLLAVYFQNFRECGDKTQALAAALGHSGLAIAMTSLTTAAGLGSFAGAEVAPISDLGLFSALGVLISLCLTLILLPALLAVWPVPKTPAGTVHAHPMLDRAIDGITGLTTSRPVPVLVASLLVVAIAAGGMVNLRFSHDPLSWLPADWPVVQATRKIDGDLRGSVVVEVMVDTLRENGLYDPKVLQTFDRLARDLERETAGDSVFVGKATSVADILKEIHQALNRNDPAFYRIPDNARLIPQEFLLFENSGSDDLEDVVDSTFRLARFSIKVPWRDALEYAPFLERIEARFKTAFGTGADISATGVMTLFGRTLTAAIHSAARSYVIAFAVITVLMILLIGNLRIGLLSMLPNIAPIVVTLGAMGWLGIPLDMFTMLIGSIAIGLAVDDTIHFMHNFRRFFAESGDVRKAVGRTLHTTGRAMVVTSIVLCLGFLVFTFASMTNLVRFGWLTGLAIAFALLADFLISPALMAIGYRHAKTDSPPKDIGATP